MPAASSIDAYGKQMVKEMCLAAGTLSFPGNNAVANMLGLL